jgi:peptidoglycan/LPS O-acetylase OafA/YrhL
MPEFAPTPYFGHSWTLGVEQKFYLFWPLIGFIVLVKVRRKTVWRLVILMALGAAAFVFPNVLIHYVVIGLGAGMAIIMNGDRGFRIVRLLTVRWVAAGAILVLVAVQLLAGWLSEAWGSQVPVVFVYGLAAALALPGLASQSATTRVLAWKPLKWLGERSYSIYLVQFLAATAVASVLAMPGNGFLKAALVAVVAAGMADFIYRGVESPAIALGKRITRRRTKTEHAVVGGEPVTQIA